MDFKKLQNILIENSKVLLKPKYFAENQEKGVHPITGHCYIGTETVYHLYAKEKGFKPYMVSNRKIAKSEDDMWTHWFLKNPLTNEIIDVTLEQFTDEELKWCYENAKGCGFLTGDKPSKRSQFVIKKFNNEEVDETFFKPKKKKTSKNKI